MPSLSSSSSSKSGMPSPSVSRYFSDKSLRPQNWQLSWGQLKKRNLLIIHFQTKDTMYIWSNLPDPWRTKRTHHSVNNMISWKYGQTGKKIILQDRITVLRDTVQFQSLELWSSSVRSDLFLEHWIQESPYIGVTWICTGMTEWMKQPKMDK